MDAPESTRVTDDTEKRLRLLRSEIECHRKKAASLRKRAEAQDRIADDKVKIASEFGTGTLPIFKENTCLSPRMASSGYYSGAGRAAGWKTPRMAMTFCRATRAASPLILCYCRLCPMRPPDQIPHSSAREQPVGSVVYFWNGQNYTRWTLKALHSFESALTIENGVGPMIVKPTECIAEETYLAEKLRVDTEEARERYKDIIHHWERGLRKSKEIGSLIDQSARATGQMIAAAKRWGLIKPD